MERRYLVAALAIIATFAVFSHGFRSLQRMSSQPTRPFGALAKLDCGSRAAARAMAKIRTHFRSRSPEEAQMLAEMNLPVDSADAEATERMARQEAECARAKATNSMERARRDFMRTQKNLARATREDVTEPISLQVNLPPDMEKQVEQKTAMAIAVNQAKLQVAAVRLQQSAMQLAALEPMVSAIAVPNPPSPPQVAAHVRCKVKTAWQQQTRQALREATRQWQYGFTSK